MSIAKGCGATNVDNVAAYDRKDRYLVLIFLVRVASPSSFWFLANVRAAHVDARQKTETGPRFDHRPDVTSSTMRTRTSPPAMIRYPLKTIIQIRLIGVSLPGGN
jgi:hypothetical protein